MQKIGSTFLNLLLLDVVLVAFAVVVSNKAPPVLPMCVNRWESECVFSMNACKMIRIPSIYNKSGILNPKHFGMNPLG